MPGRIAPDVANYVPAPKTNMNLEYADLPIIDFTTVGNPEGRRALASQVRDAMKVHGFFYVINHGYTTAQTERIFDIADVPFSGVSEEENGQYVAKISETGSFQGYKPREYWHIDGGVRDQIENYSINRNVTKRQHPKPLRPFIPELDKLARHSHEVLHSILRLLALGMELPEETLVNMHGFSSVGETYIRFMKYYPRSEEDEVKTKNVWLKGHTDMGTVTILYSQPVAALQILTKDGSWKWIRHIENSLIINARDALEFLSGGFYRPTIHRVIQPPQDQQNYPRLGVYYFCMTDDDVKLAPPVLQRDGVSESLLEVSPPTMESWRRARTVTYVRTQLKDTGSKGVEEEVINGMVVQHFNQHVAIQAIKILFNVWIWL